MKTRLFESRIVSLGELERIRSEVLFAHMYVSSLKSKGLSVGPPPINVPKGVFYQALSSDKVRIGPVEVVKKGEHYVLKGLNAEVEPPIEGEPLHAIAEVGREVKVYLAYPVEQSIVGVDVGVRHLITVVAVDKSRKVIAKKFFGTGLISEEFAKVVSTAEGLAEINTIRKKVEPVVTSAVDFIENLDPKVVVLENLKHFDNRIALVLRAATDALQRELYRRGIKYRFVNPSGTSRLCSNCGYREGELSGSTFYCPKCGLRIDRDLNAAINLAMRCYYEC
ncbi:MAG: transposase [Thermoprotei archaeon]